MGKSWGCVTKEEQERPFCVANRPVWPRVSKAKPLSDRVPLRGAPRAARTLPAERKVPEGSALPTVTEVRDWVALLGCATRWPSPRTTPPGALSIQLTNSCEFPMLLPLAKRALTGWGWREGVDGKCA